MPPQGSIKDSKALSFLRVNRDQLMLRTNGIGDPPNCVSSPTRWCSSLTRASLPGDLIRRDAGLQPCGHRGQPGGLWKRDWTRRGPQGKRHSNSCLIRCWTRTTSTQGNNLTLVHEHVEQPAAGVPLEVHLRLVEVRPFRHGRCAWNAFPTDGVTAS